MKTAAMALVVLGLAWPTAAQQVKTDDPSVLQELACYDAAAQAYVPCGGVSDVGPIVTPDDVGETVPRRELVEALANLHRANLQIVALRKQYAEDVYRLNMRIAELSEASLAQDQARVEPLVIEAHGGDPKADSWDWNAMSLVKGGRK